MRHGDGVDPETVEFEQVVVAVEAVSLGAGRASMPKPSTSSCAAQADVLATAGSGALSQDHRPLAPTRRNIPYVSEHGSRTRLGRSCTW